MFTMEDTTSYNDHGDITERRQVTRHPDVPGGVEEFLVDNDGVPINENGDPIPIRQSAESMHFTYQYDGYGNWTERTVVLLREGGHSFVRSANGTITTLDGNTIHRKLTYY
jgi:hypothetical protein